MLPILRHCILALCLFLGVRSQPCAAADAALFRVPLRRGWNLVAFPVAPDRTAPADVFGADAVGRVWTRDGRRLRRVQRLAANVGYWVFAEADADITYRADAAAARAVPQQPLQRGWNVIAPTRPLPMPPVTTTGTAPPMSRSSAPAPIRTMPTRMCAWPGRAGPAPVRIGRAGGRLRLDIAATDADGSIARVEVLADGRLVGEATRVEEGQYAAVLGDFAGGSNALSVRAVDAQGQPGFSRTVRVIWVVIEPLGTLGPNWASGMPHINDNGQILLTTANAAPIAGVYRDSDGMRKPFIWRDGVLTLLPSPARGWCTISGINAAGDVIGTALMPDGSSIARLLHFALQSRGDLRLSVGIPRPKWAICSANYCFVYVDFLCVWVYVYCSAADN